MRLGILSSIVLLSFWSWTQNSTIKFKNVNGDDYPTLSGDLWFRNPNSINTSSVTITENGKIAPLTLNGQRKGDSIAKNKAVIFLMVNPGPLKMAQFNWYRNIIASTLSSSYIQAGDKIQIMSFNQQQQGQLLFPSSFRFTDQTDILKKQLKDMYPLPYRSTCGGTKTLIWSAIDQVLDLVEKENLNIPVSIVVISDDNSCNTMQANQTPVEKAKKLGVSVYSIARNDNNRFNSIEKVCTESFGIYYMSPNNDLAQAELKVREFMLAMKERAAGQYYSFTYETSLKNDGSNQPVTVTMPGSVTDTFIQIPSKNMLQWIIANWWIVLILLAAIGFLVFYLQKNKKETKQKQFELEEKAKAEYARIKSEQERADAEMAQQLAEQERQMNQMRMKAQQEEEAKRQLQKNEHAEDRKKELLQEMRMRGNLPWLIVQIKGQEYRYEIDDPLFTIGREESNSLCIPVSTISRRHALIKFNQGEYLIEDLQSSNGVVVNGEKYQEILLAHGDVVQLGDVYLTFMI